MPTLYVSQQGCYLTLKKDLLVIKRKDKIIVSAQLPLLEQILIFGKSQITTQALRACLWRNIPIVYLSRMGYCYGRTIALERGYRQLSRYQQQIDFSEKLIISRGIVKAKLSNSKVILQRQQKLKHSLDLTQI